MTAILNSTALKDNSSVFFWDLRVNKYFLDKYEKKISNPKKNIN